MAIESERHMHADLAGADFESVKRAIRRASYSGHTAGLCSGLLQCNLVVLPEALAAEFDAFCQMNPVYCPLLGRSNAGDPRLPDLGADIDLRTDVPRYRLYQNGAFLSEHSDITELWRQDFVAFAIGCSFTFEAALVKGGIPVRHIEENVTVPMFRTSTLTNPSGPFSGPAVVSMRPIKRTDINKARQITAGFPQAHGAPVHVGDPSEIGIADLSTPDWGSRVTIKEDEVPVFWGCGVTPQVAIENASPEICITHAPGAMLITNLPQDPSSDAKPVV